MTDYHRFAKLGFEDFRRMAGDAGLSRYEKIGFPDSYRAGREAAIFRDILTKFGGLEGRGHRVLDIGPGCSELPLLLAEHCRRREQRLLWVDSPEMLAQLPDEPHIDKYPGCFPRCLELLADYRGRLNAILAYSVLQYVFVEGNLWRFVDKALSLLAEGGQLLLGDIPNGSKRKRFFASPAGQRFHRAFTGRDERPPVEFNILEEDHMDDAVVLGLLARARAQGFDAYLLPQDESLPMANRREDILIRKP